MLYLRTLGTLELTAPDGRPLDAGMTQPKRSALLAYLAIASPRGWRTRDELLALFWPEMDDFRARAALRRALHFLRAALGPDVLRARGGAVSLAEGRLDCDVFEVERALDDGRLEDAVALYGGELLAGMYVREAPAFERWLEGERSRLRRRIGDACWALAELGRDGGDAATATRWTAHAVALDPLDETGQRRGMAILADIGDVSGALRAYDAFATNLARELDLPPSPETVALAASVRASGQRIASDQEASLTSSLTDDAGTGTGTKAGIEPGAGAARNVPFTAEVDPGQASAPTPDTVPTPSQPRPHPVPELPEADAAGVRPARRRFRLSRLIPLAGALVAAAYVLGAGLLGGERRSVTAAGDADVPLRLLVLPFAVVGGSGTTVLADGMVELLSTALDGAGPLRIVDQRALPPLASPDQAPDATIRQAAGRLGVRYLVQGSMVQLGNRLEARAVLLDTTGATIASAGASGPEADLLGIADDLARQLLGAVNAGPDARLTRLAIRTSDSLAAVKPYLHGMRLLRAGAFAEAADSFRVAVKVDDDFALAYYNLSMALGWASGGRDHEATVMAKRAAQHSDALGAHDRDLMRAHAESWGGDPAVAEQLYRQIVASYPDDVEAWHELGEVIFHSGPASGRSALSARDAFQRVRHLPGLRASVRVHLARLAALGGDSVALAALADEIRVAGADDAAGAATDARDDEVLLLHDVQRQDGAAVDRWVADGRLRDDVTVWARAWSVARFTGDWRVAELVAQPLLAAGRPADVQDLGWLAIAHFRIAGGRPMAATAAVGRVGGRRADAALAFRARMAALPFVPSTAAGRAGLRDSLAAVAARVDRVPRPADADRERGGGATIAFPDEAGLPASTSPLVAQLHWRDSLDLRPDGGTRPTPIAPAVALPPVPRRTDTVLPASSRLSRADSLMVAGRAGSALAWYRSFPESDGYDVCYMALAAHGEARAAAAAGDSVGAERARARLAWLWRDAEPQATMLLESYD